MAEVDLPSTATEFLLHRSNLSPHTISFYRTQLSSFNEHCQAQGVSVADLTAGFVINYLQQRRTAGRTPQSIRAEFSAIHCFLNWCVAEGKLSREVVRPLRWPRLPKKVIEPFAIWQVRKLVNVASCSLWPERDRAILLVMADTGVRASELAAIKDGDLRGRRIKIHGKGSRERWVPISEEAAAAIKEWLKVRPPSVRYLFVTRRNRQFSRQSLYEVFKRLGIRAGVQDVRCSPHTMRHTTATEWIATGGDLLTLQRLGGWSNLEMVQRYALVNDQHVMAAHQLHGLAARL